MVYRSGIFPVIQRVMGAHLQRLKALHSCCILCGEPSHNTTDLCRACEADLPWLEPGCQACARPLPGAEDELLCGQCLASPPPFHRTTACWQFRPPVSGVIADFKYRRQLAYGRSLSLAMAEQLAGAYFDSPLPDLVTAIPLHRWRYWRRGFNQSEAIARDLAGPLGLSYQPLLRRVRATPPQQTLNAEQRRRNLRGAFGCIKPLNGETVALVDDVVTTGSTVAEAARCLLKAGAGEVHVWALAKAGD